MPNRVALRAPWWTQLSETEKSAFLEKEKDGPGATNYGVYLDDERVGSVYSVKSSEDSAVQWKFHPLEPETYESHAYSQRYEAVHKLLSHIA